MSAQTSKTITTSTSAPLSAPTSPPPASAPCHKVITALLSPGRADRLTEGRETGMAKA
ncbi:uncharacterized protein K452DRAFT_291236 [Aplosporella prunicola CBS 121167]|uniref:Uncharacterized protein n=1 Tax=Aplosporella prunicola CBS 121167 TaxID=1176127 RepID=A0A6A6B1E3_9PEZI|nr:uncharacterized protein K452DRAFT_291236 [Aplosporella prunicola CBS 121167]KAF2137860.1 hypothetical protein K452DRAFT_291236 [Aplosporella prunicola CBS 121167]